MSRNKHHPMPPRPVPLLGTPQPTKFEHQHVNGPLVFPATAVLQQPGKIDLVTVGGQFRIEALAGQIAAALVQQRDVDGISWRQSPEACDDVARDALAIARALTVELARPEEVKPETPPAAPPASVPPEVA